MYKYINDYELLYLISENNEEAYNRVYSKYRELVKVEANRIYSRCKYLGISKEDIYQAGLYGLSQAINNFNEKDNVLFYTCAKTFIIREIQTFIRNKNRNKHNILSDSVSLDKEIDEEGNCFSLFIEGDMNVHNVYDNYRKSKWILDLKYKMSFFCSQVYELRINNFSNQEISILLDVKYKMIDNAVSKIKNILKKELNEIELF